MKVALVQMNSAEDKARNLAEAERLIEEAVARGQPDLIALPEVFTFMGQDADARRAAAETLPGGPTWRLLQGLAARHRVAIHGGSQVERDGDRLYNTTVVFDREGREIARYRKIHLFDVVTPDGRVYRESDSFGRGALIVTYALDGVRIGCSICYDLRFPELYQGLARAGAEVILVPAAFTLQTGKDHWEVLLRARAIETGTYVLAPAQWGSHAGGQRQCYGHSMVVDPWGHVLARAQDRVGIVLTELDLDHLRRVREMIPVAQHKVL